MATKVSYQCAIGFSGVVFGLIVVDNNLTGATQRSIFGLFYVPAPLYPWTLLVIWQLIMPGVSFLGHLCGVLVSHGCWFASAIMHRVFAVFFPAAHRFVAANSMSGWSNAISL